MNMNLGQACRECCKISIEAGEKILEIYDGKLKNIEYKDDGTPLTIADKASNEIIIKRLKEKFPSVPVMSEEESGIPYESRKDWNYFWCVDPLDGTKEFIKRNGEFTVNIALIKANRPILGVIYVPVTGQIYFSDSENGAYKTLIERDSIQQPDPVLEKAEKLPLHHDKSTLRIVVSRSNLSEKTRQWIEKAGRKYPDYQVKQSGSSIKMCLIAEGSADVYPKYGPTSEWDTAAGQAILESAGGKIIKMEERTPLIYNKKKIINPDFLAVKNNLEI